MSLLHHFYRVTRREPCRVCGKPNWCLHARSDGRFPGFSLCNRIESPTRWGDAGWLHGEGSGGYRPAASRRVQLESAPPTNRDLLGLIRAAESRAGSDRLELLAEELGVSASSLMRLHVGRISRDLSWRAGLRRSASAWCFPMQRPGSGICGARLRLDSGEKLSVKGGREGLFVPDDVNLDGGRLVVAEGPTDVAALLDLGIPAIGRPSALGGATLLEQVVAIGCFEQVVVFGDTGSAGERGAWDLAHRLRLYCKDVRVVFPPAQLSDARDWVRTEGTRMRFERIVADADPIVFRPIIREGGVRRV